VAKKKHNRKITPADKEAAARLMAIWNREKKDRGFTQVDAGADLGMSQGAISQYLNADMALGVAATLKFARYLDVQPSEIRPDYDILLTVGTDLSREAIELAYLWQEIPDVNYRIYFQKLIAGWTDRKVG
jgi:transcriptional regulator with XRE-family HTH domain